MQGLCPELGKGSVEADGKKKMSVNHHALCCWYFPFADRLILFESLFDSLRQRQLILDPK